MNGTYEKLKDNKPKIYGYYWVRYFVLTKNSKLSPIKSEFISYFSDGLHDSGTYDEWESIDDLLKRQPGTEICGPINTPK